MNIDDHNIDDVNDLQQEILEHHPQCFLTLASFTDEDDDNENDVDSGHFDNKNPNKPNKCSAETALEVSLAIRENSLNNFNMGQLQTTAEILRKENIGDEITQMIRDFQSLDDDDLSANSGSASTSRSLENEFIINGRGKNIPIYLDDKFFKFRRLGDDPQINDTTLTSGTNSSGATLSLTDVDLDEGQSEPKPEPLRTPAAIYYLKQKKLNPKH